MAILTISRQICSLGDEIAAALASKTGGEFITREKILSGILQNFANENELRLLQESPKFFSMQSQNGVTFKDHLESELKKIAEHSSVVIMGMGAQIIFAGHPEALHIRVTASQKTRIERIKRQYRVSGEEAEKILLRGDKKHKKYVSALYGTDLSLPELYDLILNTDHLDVGECVSAILALLHEREQRKSADQKIPEDTPVIDHRSDAPIFKHPAEAEFAKILDMYQIDWQYEPKTFPIEWDAEGNVTLAFSPDFYLTKFDTFIELTTMNQKYVTTKNKKARKLRELYPGVHIKIVYKNDFHSLVKRFSPEGENE